MPLSANRVASLIIREASKKRVASFELRKDMRHHITVFLKTYPWYQQQNQEVQGKFYWKVRQCLKKQLDKQKQAQKKPDPLPKHDPRQQKLL